jgi:hypothetical protein
MVSRIWGAAAVVRRAASSGKWVTTLSSFSRGFGWMNPEQPHGSFSECMYGPGFCGCGRTDDCHSPSISRVANLAIHPWISSYVDLARPIEGLSHSVPNGHSTLMVLGWLLSYGRLGCVSDS